MLSQPNTVSIEYVRGMLSGARARGTRCDDWLWRAGIPPGLLDEKKARVTAEQYLTLLQCLAGETDEGLGFFSRPLRRGTFSMLVRSVLTSATLDVAIGRSNRLVHYHAARVLSRPPVSA